MLSVVFATSVVGEIVGLLFIVLLLGLGVVCAMKGKWVFFVLGWFTGMFWIIGASRLGKPNSFWARRRYEPAEIAEAERRFARTLVPRWGGSPWRAGVVRSDSGEDDLGK
jgi:hypothetical protein